jgi:tetratricopeptide (TPR) repeat protein
VDIGRRDALRRLALLPIHVLSLDALGTASSWAPENLLTHCATGVTACEHLSKGMGEDMSLAYAALSTYLPPLKTIVEQSSRHRKEAARLVAQALLIKATLNVHREGPKRAISYGRQAVVYSKESGDIPLRVAILKRLAWMYACDKQEKQALEAILQAQFLLEKQQKKESPIHPIIQSSIYGGIAKYQARNRQNEEALTAIHEAYDAFFASASSDKDGTFEIIDDFNYCWLIAEDGLTSYHLEQYEKALETFAQAIDPKTLTSKVSIPSERSRIEIVNHQTLASLKQPTKDMELSIRLWMAGIEGAIALQSEQRLGEALEAFSIMQALWPGDKRIKALRDLVRHW